MKCLFWIALLGTLYSYVIYPLVLLVLPRRQRVRGYADDASLPGVTLIITAHNEASRLEAKIQNALTLDYPRDRFEILVASDASTDDTDAIARLYSDRGVTLVRAEERLGKEHAQGLAVRAAKGEILAFTDTGTMLQPDGIRQIAANFADPRVGAVSSEDRFLSKDGKVVGEGLYVRYEMWLRRVESSVNSLVGLTGAFFAIRASLCKQWDINVPSDFNSALASVRQGHIAVTDPAVLAIYRDIKDPAREYHRKVRTIIRGISAVMHRPEVLNPRRMGLFAFQVWSHKMLRWAVPWFMALLLLASVGLAREGGVYLLTLIAQVAAYGAALLGWISPSHRDAAVVRIPYFFLQANMAAAQAAIAYVFGRRVTTWTPSAR